MYFLEDKWLSKAASVNIMLLLPEIKLLLEKNLTVVILEIEVWLNELSLYTIYITKALVEINSDFTEKRLVLFLNV